MRYLCDEVWGNFTIEKLVFSPVFLSWLERCQQSEK